MTEDVDAKVLRSNAICNGCGRDRKSYRITRNDDRVSSSFYGMSNLERKQGRSVNETMTLENGYIPSVNLALPPVGWHRMLVQDAQTTTVWACEKTVVMAKQPAERGIRDVSKR